jgi:hypothetical protein
MGHSNYRVIKASGDREDFSEDKVVHSLERSGLSSDISYQTLDYLKKRLSSKITTDQLFHDTSDYLRDHAPRINYYNYGLKRAIMALGPSGHPFESLVADVLSNFGYRTEVSVTLPGQCVTHEVDVLASRKKQLYLIECKFHNRPGLKTDVQTSLYVWARFLDLKSQLAKSSEYHDYALEPWLITNTKISKDAISYSKCVGLKYTAWSIPTGDSLQDLIQKSLLHPITVLDSIPADKVQSLLGMGLVTCQSLSRAIHAGKLDQQFTDIELQAMDIDIKSINCPPHE